MTTWVLLRGLGREAGHWGDFTDACRAAWEGTVVTLDLPGCGGLHRLDSPTRIKDIVDDCRRRLRRDGAPPYRLIGLSLGGMVAAGWACAHPEEVTHCVMINTSMRPFGRLHERLRAASWPAIAALALRRRAEAIEAAVLRLTSGRPGAHVDRLPAWVSIRRARPVSRATVVRQLWAAARHRAPAPSARSRVLVLCSDGDRLVDPACSRRLAAAWGCALRVHPEAGHDLPMDDAAWVLAEISSWCADARKGPLASA